MLYEGSIEAFSRDVEEQGGSVYTPRLIKDRLFVFKNETMATMSNAELEYVRLDEQSTRYPYSSALRRSLAHLEAVATICVDGAKPNLETMLSIEALELARAYGHETSIAHKGFSSEKERLAAYAAIRYSNVLQSIERGKGFSHFDSAELIKLHKALMYEPDEQADVHYRRNPYRVRISPDGLVKNVYLPPKPDDIPLLVNDLMDFCNADKLSPITQAAIAHFHLEAIRPFKTGMDRTGRAFVHAILRKRKFYRHIIPPIALVPAMNVPNHASLLFPYRMNEPFTERAAALAIDRWVMHCAQCVALSVAMVRAFMGQISAVESKWERQIPGKRSGSALDILLRELPGMPIVTVASAMALTGKGFSASNEAIHQLVEFKILEPMSDDQRNRCFVAQDAMNVLCAIVQETIPTELSSRESFFE